MGAHPADSFDLAGGTIKLHTMNRDEVYVCSLTDGTRSHSISVVDTENICFVKRKEFDSAARILGCNDSMVFGFKDEPFIFSEEVVERIVDVIRFVKPNIVITHHPNEYAHWDHAECGKAVCRALKAAMKLPGERHWVDMVYFFGVQFRPENARIGVLPQPYDILIDIGEVIQNKIEALACFESQGYNEDMIIKRVRSFEGETGRADGLEFSEGFIFYYPLKMNLLINHDIGGGFYGSKKEEH